MTKSRYKNSLLEKLSDPASRTSNSVPISSPFFLYFLPARLTHFHETAMGNETFYGAGAAISKSNYPRTNQIRDRAKTLHNRLQVVSNFGDPGEIHACARKWSPARRHATRPLLVACLLAGDHFRARARVFRRNRQN